MATKPIDELCSAAELGDIEKIGAILREETCDVNDLDLNGNTPLEQAIWFSQAESVKELLFRGANPNMEIGSNDDFPYNGNTVLGLAVVLNDANTVEALLKGGANPNHKHPEQKDYPLHAASSQDREHLIKLLIKHGADATLKNKLGKLPWELPGFPTVKVMLRNAYEAKKIKKAIAQLSKSNPLEI